MESTKSVSEMWDRALYIVCNVILLCMSLIPVNSLIMLITWKDIFGIQEMEYWLLNIFREYHLQEKYGFLLYFSFSLVVFIYIIDYDAKYQNWNTCKGVFFIVYAIAILSQVPTLLLYLFSLVTGDFSINSSN
ncbi:hypothetical protein QNI19_18265 [Cytophagaceae bacterium DM2B3-1]|uniref:Uncharacterized protein n=1 Tax=Xanthocytophaga flava TaxID=3048013 RepID=A0ABT7CQE7_9BACT|nr:hypothetical protein [Xanthocytophaga flavus]MDJ1494889.1 hypothetical protein [Xanthocytophaga flavus]